MKTYYNDFSLLTDLYQLTMAQGYYKFKKNLSVVFDMFFRLTPFKGGYVVFAGLETLVEYIINFKFSENDLEYLKNLNLFEKEFIDYLHTFRFNVDLYAFDEGEIVFPHEPIIRVHGNIAEVQLLETILLNIINFQSLIATKTARMVDAAKDIPVLEFGIRRAQGFDGALSASRAAYIGGAAATSNVLAGKLFDIPLKGTMGHSWIMAFTDELDSYEKFTQIYPSQPFVLVDTYDTINVGLPNAIRIFNNLKIKGISNFGIRIDSGDLELMSKKARSILDQAGLKQAKIIVSNELDEYIIEELINKNSPIDFFGVGTRLVTAKGDPALGGVFKLCHKKYNDTDSPCLKVTNELKKMSNPGIKNILRLYKNNMPLSDYIFLDYEKESILKNAWDKIPLIQFHPYYDNVFSKIEGYDSAKILLTKVLENGQRISKLPNIRAIREKTKTNILNLDSTYKRLLNPNVYKVSLSQNLKKMKKEIIQKYSEKYFY